MIPAHLKYSTCPSVTVHQLTTLYIPDMDTLVKGSAGQVFAVGTEGHTVDGLLVFGQGVETPTLFYLP